MRITAAASKVRLTTHSVHPKFGRTQAKKKNVAWLGVNFIPCAETLVHVVIINELRFLSKARSSLISLRYTLLNCFELIMWLRSANMFVCAALSCETKGNRYLRLIFFWFNCCVKVKCLRRQLLICIYCPFIY